MTTHQKALALNALGRLVIYIREGGDWYAHVEGVEIGGDGCLLSPTVSEPTPEAAIEAMWKRLTVFEAPGLYLVRNAFAADKGERKHVRWNGFMWSEVPR